MSELCQIYCENQRYVDLCAVQYLSTPLTGINLLPKHSALWRLAPMADPLVTEFHSRKLGSVVNAEREWAAVEEWLGRDRETIRPDQYFNSKFKSSKPKKR